MPPILYELAESCTRLYQAPVLQAPGVALCSSTARKVALLKERADAERKRAKEEEKRIEKEKKLAAQQRAKEALAAAEREKEVKLRKKNQSKAFQRSLRRKNRKEAVLPSAESLTGAHSHDMSLSTSHLLLIRELEGFKRRDMADSSGKEH